MDIDKDKLVECKDYYIDLEKNVIVYFFADGVYEEIYDSRS